MRYSTLTEELDSITKDYDYGIVPGSAAVFVKDEVMGIGRLDLTLLEGIMIVIEVSNQGYKIASSSPLSDDPMTLAAAEQVQACVERESFETMENLLMTASPLFRERFQATLYDKLHKVQQLQFMEQSQLGNEGNLHSMAQHPLPSATAATSPPSQTLLSPAAPYHDLHTSSPSAMTNQVLSPASNSNNTNTSHLDQQDLMDEINQWIH